ncbi:hypothetical protein A15D_01018 [Alcanivorax sp. MD8A]|uniref:TadE/TadG family type IV pilus assembly protein n=1 Tax=Alcanivorax sp. MD8A TaxID=1177157 RepID=UPI000C9AADF6|nr:TadE family protein [Alcanivorax sp. MD8A]PNE03310.1 hypothetical protein A15D_01018 [Alcanivorax sp. MD8A]
MTEFLITFAWGVPLIFAILQFGMLYRTKATLNDATFRAARAGSVNHAYSVEMKSALVRGMMPDNYRVAPGETPGLMDYEAEMLKHVLAYQTTHALGAKVEVTSPTQAVFTRLAKRAWVLEPCAGSACPHEGKHREVSSRNRPYQIPNDNLKQRPTTVINAGGTAMNVQDANLLSVRTLWCQEMTVPVINALVWESLDLFGGLGGPGDWLRCKAYGALHGGYHLPLSAHSVIRMQTPIRCEGNVTGNRNCKNLK